ncbi:hypothetical protein [Jonesia denitrificans]|nr:hypothetical protein [Jonesia denitrificans]QXB43955.1 hypothetical protein I6L70_03490 [Jonesia denitrificans]SQH21616.1 Uncharacterised protein [Jonesia denitrificans]
MTGSLSGRGVDGSTVCEVFVYRRSGELTVDALAEYARGRSVIAGVGPGEDCGVPGTVVLRVAVDNDTGSVLRTDSSGLLDASDHVDVWLTQLARHLGVSVDYGDGSVIRPNGDEVELDTPERPGSVRRVVLWDQDCVYDAVLCADGVGVPLWLGSWPGVTAFSPIALETLSYAVEERTLRARGVRRPWNVWSRGTRVGLLMGAAWGVLLALAGVTLAVSSWNAGELNWFEGIGLTFLVGLFSWTAWASVRALPVIKQAPRLIPPTLRQQDEPFV